ncbi:MAG TPA: hypothetical protein VJ742_08345, partial [Nitrososphaera sp.]|nr:hypothetical protein [Nitrososphaera sp.]
LRFRKYYRDRYKIDRANVLLRCKKYRKSFSGRMSKILSTIKQRCSNPNISSYKYYGAKGIKCLINKDEIVRLWFRDKAFKMKKPSIDRKTSKHNYSFKNCRFIELSDNIRKSNYEKPRYLCSSAT